MASATVTADRDWGRSRLTLGLLFILTDELINQNHTLASIGLLESFPVVRALIAKLSTLGGFGRVIKVF